MQASQWYTDSADGNFQSIIHWGNGGTNPYTQYDNWLDYNNSAPIGKTATADFGRYHNAAVQSALTKLAATDPANTAAVKAASLPLEKIMATTAAGRPAAVRRGLGRVLHGELHRLRDGGEPVHGPVAERPSSCPTS